MGRSKTITREQIEEILAARSRGEKPRDTAGSLTPLRPQRSYFMPSYLFSFARYFSIIFVLLFPYHPQR